jgi:hypothetical protein
MSVILIDPHADALSRRRLHLINRCVALAGTIRRLGLPSDVATTLTEMAALLEAAGCRDLREHGDRIDALLDEIEEQIGGYHAC